ncbi:MAG: energy-coupling factor transporter transmembrane protein EcfT [Eubacterium sp.]|nr:energy-coupling factor transporter transmembrane protein EcfT [Eubacterium sp.]
MAWEVLSSQTEHKGIHLDPRTKLILLITICILVVGGEVSGIMMIIKPLASMIPFALLLTIGKWKRALFFTILFAILFVGEIAILPSMGGTIGFLLLFLCGVFGRLLPGIIMGYFTVSTTTVSEFIASMERIHLSQKIVIPLAVMFRFFPTVMEEYHSIGDAMKMRGIRLGGKKTGKILEYRFIPMMICSVKIGEELSAAALTRGLGMPVKRTNICEIGFHKADIFFNLLCLIMLGLNILRMIGIF